MGYGIFGFWIGPNSIGITLLLVREHSLRNILYYIGIIGNSMLVITFVLVRLVTPPFSPEVTPINELEPNGIITLIIEIVLVILMVYQLKKTLQKRM